MLSNEEKLKEMRNLLVLNPDDPLDDFLTPADLTDLIELCGEGE